MATLPTSKLVAISTPYARKGLLYQKWKALYGKDDPRAICIQASTQQLNRTIDESIIAAALEEDAASASAEWLGLFRADIAGFITPELLDAVVDKGVTVRAPQAGFRYFGYTDSASGTGKDLFAVCVAHAEKDKPILDAAHEIRPPFSPTQAIEQVSALLKSYRVFTVTGDRYAPGFVTEGFARCGIRYVFSEFDRSETYLEALPLLTSGRAKLLDVKRMLAQFASLERRVLPTGRDRVDHPHGDKAHDDLANSAAGALALAGARNQSLTAEQMKAIIAQSQARARDPYGGLGERGYLQQQRRRYGGGW